LELKVDVRQVNHNQVAHVVDAGARETRGFTLVELVVTLIIIGIIAAIALPNYVKLKDKAKEAETKAGLHNIQLALEQFAVDNNGNYPQFLVGGDNAAKDLNYHENHRDVAAIFETDMSMSPDALLRGGYVSAYPSNPFVTNSVPVQQMQAMEGDPLRSSRIDGKLMGTRFGPDCNLMGQVLCDSRWPTREVWNFEYGAYITLDNWTNIQYDFYDIWLGHVQRPFLPGSFFYKSIGEIMPHGNRSRSGVTVKVGDEVALVPQDIRTNAVRPTALTDYMLGAWGGARTKGMDILGEEPLVIYSYNLTKPVKYIPAPSTNGPISDIHDVPDMPATTHYSFLGVPPWTRSVNKAHIGPLWGSPYGPAPSGTQQLSYGNPNGIKDALILMLSAGHDSED
jgi:prepilin-type N-terminal cleavage/methylation domain-containing protein